MRNRLCLHCNAPLIEYRKRMGASVCAIIISYKPTQDLYRRVEMLCGQSSHALIVDNTPANIDTDILTVVERLHGCTVIRNGKNFGIAAALNIGIRWAIAAGFQWVITFDQDSQVSDGFVDASLRTYEIHAKAVKVGIVCPRYKDAQSGVLLEAHKGADGYLRDCMTSGSMMNAEAFMSIGPMEERLFIDSVDHEYCLRMRVAGWKIVESPDSLLFHSLGRMTFHRFLGRRISTTNHSPERRYYMCRNRLVLIQRYLLEDPNWAFAELRGLVMDSVKVLLMEDAKLAKVRYMVRGTVDAFFRRMGPRVEL